MNISEERTAYIFKVYECLSALLPLLVNL